MIELKNVSKYYTANGITNLGLHNISLELNKGEIVAITGDSGSGKSTLLNVITKIDTFDEGEIYYKGNETSYFSISDMDDFRKNKVGFIFQNYNIIDSYTVLENVMLPLLLKGFSNQEAAAKARELINKVGLSKRENHRGTKLSGGEKQRCVIARALASDCEILACDEPTGNLDSKTGKEIIELIKEIAKDKLVLIVTHNFDEVKDVVTRKLRIADGELIEDQIFESKETDPKEELNLDYVPSKMKTKCKIAKNNVVFTPKKTVLLSMVFFVVSFVFLFLMQVVFSVYNGLSINSVYSNTLENRLVVYNKDYSELNIDKLKSISDKIEVNDFYSDYRMTISGNEENYYDYLLNGFIGNYIQDNIHQIGTEEINENEIYITLPENDSYYVEKLKGYLNSEIYFSFNSNYGSTGLANRKLKLVGIGYSKNISYNYFKCSENVMNYARATTTRFDATYTYETQRYNIVKSYVEKSGEPTLIIPENMKDKIEYSIMLAGIYDYSCIDVIYSNDISSPKLEIPSELTLNKKAFQISMYENGVDKTAKKIRQLGYDCDIAEKCSDENLSLEMYIERLYAYILMVCICVGMIAVFYMTYFILARIYASKKNDYQILRTLGVTKRDMRTIVNLEVLFIGLSTVVFSYVLLNVLIYTIDAMKIFRPISFVTSLMYFITMILFTYAIGRRFNKKLFKFSVTKTMKGDDLND